jgi:hypothetical protein
MDHLDDDEYWLLPLGQQDYRAQEPMRQRQKVRTNPSPEDRKVRHRNRRSTAGGDVQKRAELVRALQKAATFTEQERLLDEIANIDKGLRAQAAQDRELDLSSTVVRETLTPVRVHEHHTAATDWIADEQEIDPQWRSRVVAEAATWFGRVAAMVKADPEEYAIQAEGMARRVAGPYGLQAEAAREEFLQYAAFLNREAASGLDQIQQTVDPNNAPKTTPLPTEVFDNFAPEIDPINQGVSGTEDSNRAPLIQEIVNGGSGMDGGAPEKPGGHSETDELSWAPPSGMQADTAPGWSDGDPGTPEKGGDRPDYTKGASLSFHSGMAINHSMTLDQYKAAQAQATRTAQKAASLGKCAGCGTDLTVGNAADREGKVCKSCASKSASRKDAASGLPMIQETVDANNQPHTPIPIPPAVAFPLDGDMQQEWTTDGTGNAHPGAGQGQKAAVRKKADMFGGGDAPHMVVQPNVANTPDTTPPTADNAGGAAAGAADARAEGRPSFADNSSAIPAPAQQYAQGYSGAEPPGVADPDVPASMAGPGNGVTHAGTKISSLITTATERDNADFRKGYGYASRWTPGTRLVTTGSKEFEAGLYAGISDNTEHQKAFVDAHRTASQRFPALGERVARHKAVTARVVAKNEVPSNGLYLLASTSIDLNTMAPNTTPAADGSTPINGPGRPGPLDGQQGAAAPGGPSPYNGAEPFGTPVVPGAGQAPEAQNPTDALLGGGGMSTNNQVMAAASPQEFRRRVQAGLLALRQGK